MASTHEDIMAVLEDEIGKKSYIVETKFGKKAFYENFRDMQVRKNSDVDPTWVKRRKK